MSKLSTAITAQCYSNYHSIKKLRTLSQTKFLHQNLPHSVAERQKPLYKSLKYQNLHSPLSVQYPESTIHSLKRYSNKKLNFNGAAVTANFMPSITEKTLLLSNPLLHSKLTMYQSAITAKYSALQSSNHAVTLFSCPSLTPRHLLI